MNGKNMRFLHGANQVLFFVIAVGVVVAALWAGYRHWFAGPDVYEPPRVEIKEPPAERAAPPEPEFELRFERRIKDVYVFSLIREQIVRGQVHAPDAAAETAFVRSRYSPQQVVNMVFSTPDNGKHVLFKKDAHITSYYLAQFEDAGPEPLSAPERPRQVEINIYLVAESDTDGDGALSEADRRSLYVSEYDGGSLEKLRDNVTDYRIVSADELLIQVGEGRETAFFRYRIDVETLEPIDTSVQYTWEQ